MYLRRFQIKNVRSIDSLEMDFPRGQEAGWHVILGQNGSGKSSVVRSFALLMMGQKEAYASRQDFTRWIRNPGDEAVIDGIILRDIESAWDALSGSGPPPKNPILPRVSLSWLGEGHARRVEPIYSGQLVDRTLWGTGTGWFSASFGPFRRFTGGDRIYDKLFISNRRLAPHLSALGEDVALTEALSWLTSLHVQQLQDLRNSESSYSGHVLDKIIEFLNKSDFLPHDSYIHSVTNEQVLVQDGNGAVVSLDQLSDGYRSALSLTLELMRQMFELYGHEIMGDAFQSHLGRVVAPGVVAIDEIDAHLHPSWQRNIGRWLTRCFPYVQFIVTTHSPIVCRAIIDDDDNLRGTIWRLPAPGSGDRFQQVVGDDLNSLAYGDVLDAFGTELFGRDVMRSPAGHHKLARLAALNRAALERALTEREKGERRDLRSIFPAGAGTLDAATVPR
ncbi:MAG: ATP-binding protein [Acetobacteraceae bacterium]|nr:ATP-binding protein [Acetobacteraceae bacterium]